MVVLILTIHLSTLGKKSKTNAINCYKISIKLLNNSTKKIFWSFHSLNTHQVFSKSIRVNVPIVVQFVVVHMCFNGFKMSGRTILDYFNTLQLEYVLYSQSQTFLPRNTSILRKNTYFCDCFVVPIMVVVVLCSYSGGKQRCLRTVYNINETYFWT